MSRWHSVVAAIAVLALTGCGADDGDERAATPGPIILATTTSTQDSGLLDDLVPAFARATGIRVKTIAVGSGQALEMGRRGEADVVLAHSPAAELELVETGVAGARRLVMHNDFIVLGPAADPAGVRGRRAVAAFARIAAARAPFVSRGDDSGTHRFELGLWEDAKTKPSGRWYEESGQGMAATLRIADERDAYTLSDRATWLATADESRLRILVDGGPGLLNVYHVIPITRRAGSRVNEEGGSAFARWITSPEAQRRIAAFGRARFGRPLFAPDAGRSEEQVQEAA
jgi:tungstate transport system substrate-binding protein